MLLVIPLCFIGWQMMPATRYRHPRQDTRKGCPYISFGRLGDRSTDTRRGWPYVSFWWFVIWVCWVNVFSFCWVVSDIETGLFEFRDTNDMFMIAFLPDVARILDYVVGFDVA